MEKEAKGPKGRIFLGLPVSVEAQGVIKKTTYKSFQKFKEKDLPVPSFNWHLTLAYFGSQNQTEHEHTIETIEKFLDERATKGPLELTYGGLGAFPTDERARVLWMDVKTGSENLETLAKDIREKLTQSGVAFDPKPFIPHLTLFRLKFPRNLTGFMEREGTLGNVQDQIQDLILYQSCGSARDPYRVLKKWSLS